MTATAPPVYANPGNGSSGYSLFPATRQDYDCALDSLAYLPDGRLVVARPINVTQDQYIQCDLGSNSSGCTIQTSKTNNTFQVYGNPTLQDIVVTLKPSPTLTAWFPININTSTDFNASIPIASGNWSAQYNITNVVSTNCTSLVPIEDPLVPGWGCASIGDYTQRYATYRPMDTANFTYMGPVFFYTPGNDSIIDANETERVPCTTLPPPLYTCATGLPYYRDSDIGIMLSASLFYVPFLFTEPTWCVGTYLPRNTTCRYNRLYYQFDDVSDLQPLITRSGYAIPCFNQLVLNYTCPVNSTGPATASNGTSNKDLIYYFNNSAALNRSLPCIQNTAAAAPLCRQVDVTYAFGMNATVIVEGVGVRVYIDGVRQALRCTSPALSSLAASASGSSVLAGVQDYYNVRVDTEAKAWDVRYLETRERVRQQLRTPMSMAMPFVNIANVTLYPKASLTCCAARMLRSLGHFIVAFYFEILYTVRSLLTLPALIPDYTFEVPTFRDALDEFRDALCEFMCMLTRIIPAEYTCTFSGNPTGCNSGPSCAQGLLCHIADVPLLLAEILVEILVTIRDLTDNEGAVPTSSPVLGDDCGVNNVGGCIASIIVYIITKVIFTLTQIGRDLAANVDCLIAAITVALDNGSTYPTPIIFSIVNPIMTLIEGLVGDVLSAIIKFVISVITTIVYLFTGQIDLFVTELGQVFEYLGDIFVNLGEVILQFLLQIPVIKDIVGFFVEVIQGACQFLEDAINVFAGDNPVDLSCGDITLKRGILSAPGWLPTVYPDHWASMSTACHTAIQHYNASGYTSMTDDNMRRELTFCLKSYYWMVQVPEAHAVDGYENACDFRMPTLYAANKRWAQFTTEELTFIKGCMPVRQAVEKLQKSAPFVPRDILDNFPTRLFDFGEQMLFAYSAHRQYRQDRVYPIETVLSENYLANWQDDGFSVAHLEALKELPRAEADDALGSNDDEAPAYLSIRSYALRAIDADRNAARLPWRRTRARNVEQITSAMRFVDEWVGGGTSLSSVSRRKREAETPSGTGRRSAVLVGQFVNFTVEKMARRRVLAPPTLNFSLYAAPASATGPRRMSTGRLTMDALADTATITARFIKGARNEELLSKVYVAGGSIGQIGYAALIGSVGVVRDLFSSAWTTNSASGVTAANQKPGIWKSKADGSSVSLGGLFTSMTQSLTSVVAAGFTMAGARPASTYALFTRLSAASPEAQLRRDKMRAVMVGAQLSLSASFARGTGGSVPEVEMTPELRSLLYSISHAGGVRANLVDCDINITGLCESCLYLGTGLTVLETGIETTAGYYTGNVSQEPSYAYSTQQFEDVRDYLNNSAASVILGDSPDNPPRWPWYDRSNLRILGDFTPNKLRFSSLSGLFQETLDLILGDGTGQFATADPATASGINVFTAQILGSVHGAVRDSVWTPPPRAANGSVTITARSPSELLLGWYDYFWGWIRTCNFVEELDGSQKNLSIGEGVGVMVCVAIVISLFVGAGVPLSFGIVGMALLMGTLVVTYGWSYRCGLALPQQLADDLMHFFTYTLLARAPWFAGGIIKNDTFTADQAGLCANYAAPSEGGYDYYHCVNELGFKDFGYVMAFILQTTTPSTVAWLNETTLPLFEQIIHLDFVQLRLNAFVDTYNASDPISYSAHNSCAYIYVGWSHLAIFQLVMQGAILLAPLLGILVALITGFFIFVAALYLLGHAVLTFVTMVPVRVGMARAEATRIAYADSLHYYDALEPPPTFRAYRQLRGAFMRRFYNRV